ncbi:hypothetical protein RvY_11987 [Ramazzottius varieornatus]|uniref:Uncharacterized protein n=1 Tax=Ramazzottius varieornatus TaxID=947166 RepID=A0A1D1VHW4_RAMVA|nr:hypothetical protein RvY_11987 [Ramazzottius varieornatus]
MFVAQMLISKAMGYVPLSNDSENRETSAVTVGKTLLQVGLKCLSVAFFLCQVLYLCVLLEILTLGYKYPRSMPLTSSPVMWLLDMSTMIPSLLCKLNCALKHRFSKTDKQTITLAASITFLIKELADNDKTQETSGPDMQANSTSHNLHYSYYHPY